MVSSSGVKENPGKAFRILSFSNQVRLCATLTLSFVRSGFLPVNNDFSFSIRQAIASRNGVVCFFGRFLPNASAMVSCNFLKGHESPFTIKRCSFIVLSINAMVATPTSRGSRSGREPVARPALGLVARRRPRTLGASVTPVVVGTAAAGRTVLWRSVARCSSASGCRSA